MRRFVPTKVTKTEEIEHVYCNKCGSEVNLNTVSRKDVEITLDVKETIQKFVLCFNCLVNWLIPALKFPPDEIDMREG